MINRSALLSDLQKLLKRLEADLLERSDSPDVPAVGETLRTEYEQARTAERTAQNYEDWRSDAITQAAAAWVLSAVFVRFLEDNQLIEPPRFSGPGDQLQRARDERELYFRAHPTETDREYLLAVFDELATLPGTREVFGDHNPLRELPQWLSGDAAGELLAFFQKIDANAGGLVHDFTDADWDTRFLGDLYQDLSEAARKKYALLQTPEFVEEFILDRTLEPALDEFGLDAPPVTDAQGTAVTPAGFRMIDPACGSGHFLLGTFPRLLDRWYRKEPGGKVRDLVQKTLDSIHGVDVNPYAIAIARFRLLLKAMQACDIHQLKNAPAFTLHLACGDSLLHSPLRGGQQVFDFELTSDDAECEHAYQSEDLPALKQTLRSGIYHAVVANPPYITPKDRQLNQRYRTRFESCHMKYSLAVPFLERIFRLAVTGGFTGQITANSFMKREFGKKLIEQFLPQIDLTHIVDTSGAYIPGHATPTVILFGRHRKPISNVIRTVMGIRGEPSPPKDASQGLVWSAIINQIDCVGSESEFMSVADSKRDLFKIHPWSISGGGASDLKKRLDMNSKSELGQLVHSIGPASFAGVDDAFVSTPGSLNRSQIPRNLIRSFVAGDQLRDWKIIIEENAFTPYDQNLEPLHIDKNETWSKRLWNLRHTLESVTSFGGKTRKELGEKWWTWYRWIPERIQASPRILFATVATHNQFVFDNNKIASNRHSPVILISECETDDDYHVLLGLLNSSLSCFWLKQVCNCKGLGGQGGGIKPEDWHRAYEFDATKIGKLPVPDQIRDCLELSKRLNMLSMEYINILPGSILAAYKANLTQLLENAESKYIDLFREMTAIQEELDWLVYDLFGLHDYTPATEEAIKSGLDPQERPVEVLLKKRVENGEPSIFYEVHKDRKTAFQKALSSEMKSVIERRLKAIEASAELRLIETPNHKRRWQVTPWNAMVKLSCHDWLLDRLERYFDFDGRMNPEGTPTAEIDIQLISIAQLADIARRDPQFLEVGAVYRDDSAFDVQRLIDELVHAEQVPLLPILRYKPAGLRKRAEWEQTWELQRREDAIDARTELPEDDPQYLTPQAAQDLKQAEVGDIPVPPKYKSSDFLSTGGVRYWALRGKLDVPKERWISFPHCEGPDGTPVIAWAGYDHLQLARAISAYFVEVQEQFGGRDDPRLIPLLACLDELLPWLKQWHHDLDPEFNQRMDEVFAGFLTTEAKALDMTIDQIKNWQPPKKTKKTATKRKAKK